MSRQCDECGQYGGHKPGCGTDAPGPVEFECSCDWTPGRTVMNRCSLHAAAPAMLAALVNLRARATRAMPTPYGHACHWCAGCYDRADQEAEAAIAAAKGEA